MERRKNGLIQKVIRLSKANIWRKAREEWEIIECLVDPKSASKCLCGTEHIKYLFRIYNSETKKVLFPVGSSCIQLFERNDLSHEVASYEKMGILLERVSRGKYIELNSEIFSRNLLFLLYQKGCFKRTPYNHYCGKNDYLFLLEMFNRKKKRTPKEEKRVCAILVNQVIPFCQKEIKMISSQ